MQEKKQRRNTILLAVILLAVCGIGLLVQKMVSKPIVQDPETQDSGMVALVSLNGQVIRSLDLDEDTNVLIGDRETDYNVISVKDGKVSVTDANCADKICVQTGQMQLSGDIIACLPHGLIIYITEEEDSGSE
jgi:hypothetical protein